MKVAVASLGTVPEALVGIRFGTCSQFLVFDLDTMSHVVIGVPPRAEPADHVSVEAIRAVARQDVTAVITGDIKDACRRTLNELGIDVISGVRGMTVLEAVERYKADLGGVRAIVKSGAASVITAHVSPACCMALQALSVPAHLAPAGITVREAIDRYRRGELEEIGPVF